MVDFMPCSKFESFCVYTLNPFQTLICAVQYSAHVPFPQLDFQLPPN
jgi:hypothetical protein